MVGIRGSIVTFVFAILLLAGEGLAATYTVTNTTDIDDGGNCDANCSLREAVNRANQTGAADTIVFAPGVTGTITLGSTLTITNALTITGPSVPLTVSGNNLVRVFTFQSTTGSITDLTISNGSAGGAGGGGILNQGSALTLNRVTLTGNAATGGSQGGAIQNLGTLTVYNSTISGNTAPAGAAVHFSSGMSVFVNVTITNNTATFAGALRQTGGTATLTNTIVAGNPGDTDPDVEGSYVSGGNNFIGIVRFATGFTDGVSNDQVGSTATPKDPMLNPLGNYGGPTFTHELRTGSPAINAGSNTAATSAGLTTDQRGIARPQGPTVDIGAFEVIRFTVTEFGPLTTDGVCDANCTLLDALNLANANPDENVIDFSPSAFNTPRTIDLTGVGELNIVNPVAILGPNSGLTLIADNNSRVLNIHPGVTVALWNMAITNGRSTSAGGGIFNEGNLTLRNVLLTNNQTTSFSSGGAIFNNTAATLTILNSTISGNISFDEAGGIANRGTMTLKNATITQNSSGNAGGGVISFSGSTTNVVNTIIAGNTAPSITPAQDLGGTFVSQGHNFIGKSDGSTGFNSVGDQVGTVAAPKDPMLGALVNNGGTTFTHALILGSTAIDAGDDAAATNAGLTTDQRGLGFPRIFGAHVDIGAFEFMVVNFTVTKTADTDDGVCDTDCSLREAIAAANALPDSNMIDFSPSVFNTPQTINLSSELSITNPASITGSDSGILISGSNLHRVIAINSGVTVNLSKLAIGFGNSPPSGGCILNSGTLTLDRLLVINCLSDSSGGGVANNGTLTILNSTFSGNRALIDGGAVYNTGTLTLVNDTITLNNANVGGGVFNTATANVANTIIAGNMVLVFQGPDVSGAFNSQGHNFIGTSNDSTGFTDGQNSDQVGTNAARKNPMLGPLALNGGPTATHALLPGSTAINGGDNAAAATAGLTTDQRGSGFARVVGPNVDIGAFEALAPTAAGVTISGRVTDIYGRSISGVIVSVTQFDGVVYRATTNTFGYFKFQDIRAGQSVVLSATARRYTFDSQILNLEDSITNIQLRPR